MTLVPRFPSAQLELDNVLQLHSISWKLADSIREFIGCHLVFVQQPTKRLFIEWNLVNVLFLCCKEVLQFLQASWLTTSTTTIYLASFSDVKIRCDTNAFTTTMSSDHKHNCDSSLIYCFWACRSLVLCVLDHQLKKVGVQIPTKADSCFEISAPFAHPTELDNTISTLSVVRAVGEGNHWQSLLMCQG